jgi:hypothetical protein
LEKAGEIKKDVHRAFAKLNHWEFMDFFEALRLHPRSSRGFLRKNEIK